MKQIGVIGGGPGGLFTAYLLEQKCKDGCKIIVFEAAGRTGGKVLTRLFDSVPAIYEAGVAEVYDYSMCGRDPLLQLVRNLGLERIQMNGGTVVLNGRVLSNEYEIGLYSHSVLRAIKQFRSRAVRAMPVKEWYEGNYRFDNQHPWAQVTCQDVLAQVKNLTARKYLKVSVHSDLATEPHLTNGLNGLKNFLMDVPGYIRLYSVAGGIEQIPRALQKQLTTTELRINSPVVRVQKAVGDGYRIFWQGECQVEYDDFDAVFVAVPQNYLANIQWGGEGLDNAMSQFIGHYDRPGHYLRIIVLFRKPFWRDIITGSWFTLEAFGGSCVYDESARYPAGGYGVLGWLIAGTDALSMASLGDQALVELVLHSLPNPLSSEAQHLFLEGKVYRWLDSVSAQPGGYPVRNPRSAHLPEPKRHPKLFIVGDYLFDSTLNGVLDSADTATDLFQARFLKRDVLRIAGDSVPQDSRKFLRRLTSRRSRLRRHSATTKHD